MSEWEQRQIAGLMNANSSDEIFGRLRHWAKEFLFPMNKIQNQDLRLEALNRTWGKLAAKLDIGELKNLAFSIFTAATAYLEKFQYSERPTLPEPMSDEFKRTASEIEGFYEQFHLKGATKTRFRDVLFLHERVTAGFLKRIGVTAFAKRTFELYYGIGLENFVGEYHQEDLIKKIGKAVRVKEQMESEKPE
jgi:hypothetical protein